MSFRFSVGCWLAMVSLAFVGCGAPATHGELSHMSAVGEDAGLCEHRVPAEVCVQCHPELEARFREVGDWCGPHRVPESQCHRCHPDLDFSPLPAVAEGADVADLSDDQVMAGLEQHLAPGRVTVVDFHAAWCAPCLNLERHLRGWLERAPDLAVRRVDVAAWSGPVYDTYLTRVATLPYVRVYDQDGALVAELAGFDNDELDAVLHDLLGPR